MGQGSRGGNQERRHDDVHTYTGYHESPHKAQRGAGEWDRRHGRNTGKEEKEVPGHNPVTRAEGSDADGWRGQDHTDMTHGGTHATPNHKGKDYRTKERPGKTTKGAGDTGEGDPRKRRRGGREKGGQKKDQKRHMHAEKQKKGYASGEVEQAEETKRQIPAMSSPTTP